jgi:hypothetical protein
MPKRNSDRGLERLNGSPRSANIQAGCPLVKTIRKRSKAHLAFVAAQACLICKR